MDIVGLALSFSGAILIFLFGISPRISAKGVIYLIAEQKDKEEIKKAKIYKVISIIGVILLTVGFFLQLLEKVV